MDIPSFHDGRFDGFWIGADEAVHLFLRTQGGERFTLILRGIERLILSEIKEGNIIFDVVFRDSGQLTTSDIDELYDVKAHSPQAASLLEKAREKGLRALEINPSYGAFALFLFQTSEIRETNPLPTPD
jgi:hypothetical protein